MTEIMEKLVLINLTKRNIIEGVRLTPNDMSQARKYIEKCKSLLNDEQFSKLESAIEEIKEVKLMKDFLNGLFNHITNPPKAPNLTKVDKDVWDLALIIDEAKWNDARAWAMGKYVPPDYDTYNYNPSASMDISIAAAEAVLKAGYRKGVLK